jgi:membrane associated rhomboid family serine protease
MTGGPNAWATQYPQLHHGLYIEKIIGRCGFALLYFASSLGGGISLIASRPGATGYGASLSVLGLLGGLIGFYGSRRVLLSNRARWKLAVLFVIAIVSIWDDTLSI